MAVLLVGFVVGVSVNAARSGERYQVLRRLRGKARVAIRDAQGGTVAKLVGVVRLGPAPLRSPDSGAECAYDHCVVVDLDPQGVYPAGHVREDDERGQDFVLDDGTGTALVRLHPLAMQVHVRDRETSQKRAEHLITEGQRRCRARSDPHVSGRRIRLAESPRRQ